MDTAPLLLALGGLFAAGLVADLVGRRTRLPRVTLLLGCGLLAGSPGFNLIPAALTDWFDTISVIALTMVAFVLGGTLSRSTLMAHGWAILAISILIVAITLAGVALGLTALGLDLGLALILGAIATATDPAAVQDAIRQYGRETGFTKTLKGIVAVDDAWGVLVFALVIVLVQQMAGDGGSGMLVHAVTEVAGSIALGLVIGVPAAFITGRISGGGPIESEALAVVFLTAGAALWLDLSYLIAGMTAGAVIVNTARHHKRAFHEIEHIEWPFLILFFVLAGASLDWTALIAAGWIGVGYVVLRALGRIVGGWAGAIVAGAPVRERNWYGPALMPQAGVAVGMALVASEVFPEWAATIMALTIATTVIFELAGPPATLWSVRKVEEGR
ncbi:MAG: cation:proton antiporter [Pseudomonadota bacterium]